MQACAREIDANSVPNSVPVGLYSACDTGHYEVPPLAPLAVGCSAPAASVAHLPVPDLSSWNPGLPPTPSGVALPSDHGNSFASNLLSDMGLIHVGGQTWDYWTQNGVGVGDSSGSGSGSVDPSGLGATPRPAGANGLADAGPELDLSAFHGGGAHVNTQDAAQVLLNQLTGGW